MGDGRQETGEEQLVGIFRRSERRDGGDGAKCTNLTNVSRTFGNLEEFRIWMQDGEARRRGDEETIGRGDAETRRQGHEEKTRPGQIVVGV